MIKAILFASILALGTLLFFQWRYWPPELPAEGKRVGTADLGISSVVAGKQNPLDLLSPPLHEADYVSIAERPLFRPDRRPPEEEPEEPEPEPVAEQEPAVSLDTMDLVAVLITPGNAIAWVRTQTDPTPKRFRVGDMIEGWQLKAIHPNELELTQDGKTDWLVLRNYAQPFQPKRPTPRGRNRRPTQANPKRPATRAVPQRRPRPPVRNRPTPKPQKRPPQPKNPASKPPTPHLGPRP